MREINKIILHCTDSDDSLDIGFKEVNSWHRDRGWMSPSGISCGYHYIVRRNGKIESGRPENEVGAHCYGHNWDSIGISWVGRNNIDYKQLNKTIELINRIRKTYSLDVDDVFGHYEFDKHKTCPNLYMVWIRAELLFTKG